MRECIICGDEFDPKSPTKRHVGGKITHCPDCSDETAVPYLGLASGDGKQAGVTILKFESDADREAYREMWWVNSGMMVGKSCQLGMQKRTPTHVHFETVVQSKATNHKGQAGSR
jgi:hypothetical protein